MLASRAQTALPPVRRPGARAERCCAPNEPVASRRAPPVGLDRARRRRRPPAPDGEGQGEAAPAGDKLTAQIKNRRRRHGGHRRLRILQRLRHHHRKTTGPGELTPGFHGLHIHSVGKCEASSVAPTGGEPGDFNSAGGHFQVPGHSGHPASGDLTSLQVREDGTANW